MCCKKASFDFKVGDHIVARKAFQVNSGDHVCIAKKQHGIIQSINGTTAMVLFTVNGQDHEVLVRFDYMKPEK